MSPSPDEGAPVDPASFPSNPGVYLFKDRTKKVLYVGKAKNLKKRVKSYFLKSSARDTRKNAMIGEVKEVSYIVTANELEAFVLEANLIKQYRPRYNVVLRDDKSYPYLKLSVQEPWPSIAVVRKIEKDGALYFGPYVPSRSMWESLAFIRRYFHIRDCRFSLDKPMRPCIQHQIGKCAGPCSGEVSREEYRKLVDEVRLFLSGERKNLLAGMKKRMQELSSEMRFEEAAQVRDRIRAIEAAWESQKVIAPELSDVDVIGLHRGNGESALRVFFIRSGVMTGSKDFFIRGTDGIPEGELLRTFITQFYTKEVIPPPEILVSRMPSEVESLNRLLAGLRGSRVVIRIPQKGKKKGLVAMASENAQFLFHSKRPGEDPEPALAGIRQKLNLRKIPRSIGAFDISNLSGGEAVGAFICWSAGSFIKDAYRRLKIRTVRGIDDYAMMEEAVSRMVDHLGGELPDLLLIDGGKGHLNAALKAVGKRGSMKTMPELIAVAKDPDRAFTPDSDNAVDLSDRSSSSLLLRRIRDEVHRFAVGYHRTLRGKSMLRSPLEEIRGIGKKRRLELLKVFGSIDEIQSASVETVARLKGFNRKIAGELIEQLRRGS
jgi:excinuclease ABC subunit C